MKDMTKGGMIWAMVILRVRRRYKPVVPRRSATSERKMTAAKTRTDMATLWRPSWALASGLGRRRAEAIVAVKISIILRHTYVGILTGAKRKHIWQRSRCIEDGVELSGCQQDPPSRHIPPQSYAKPRSEEVEASGVEEAQDRSNDKLGVGKAEESNQRLAEAGQQHRPYK